MSVIQDSKARPVHAVAIALLLSGTAAAQVQLDRFYPPVVAIGDETSVKADGKFPTWPVELVCDRKGLQFKPEKDPGVWRAVVPPDEAPGAAWVRVHDKQSASKLVPLLIEPLPPLSEIEPNDRMDQSTRVELPAVVVGRLGKSGDVDTFRVSAGSGQTLVVSAMAHRVLGSPMDAVLQLVDAGGNVIVQSDDACGLDPQIVHRVKADGELLIRMFAFPKTPNSTIGYAGGDSFVYTLRVTTEGLLDHVLPLVVAEGDQSGITAYGWNLPPDAQVRQFPASSTSPVTAHLPETLGWQWQLRGPSGAASLFDSDGGVATLAGGLPLIFSGHIGQSREVDRVRFHVDKGGRYRASVVSRIFGFQLDSVLRVMDAAGASELGRNDDQARNQYDAALGFTAKNDGEIELLISDLVDGFGPGHAYSVVIEQTRPSAELRLEADHVGVTVGKSVEIPVAITRLHGFQRKVRISAEDLPAGVTAEAAVSEAKGSTAKSVKLKLTAQPGTAYQGTFRIVGHVLDAEQKQTLVAVYQLRDAVSIEDIWLTVAPASP